MYNITLLMKVVLGLLMHYCMPTLGEDMLYNVALYKPAYQSSLYGKWFANYGNDGRTSGFVHNNVCIHTLSEYNSWWMVDLLDTFVIKSIILTNRLVHKTVLMQKRETYIVTT